MFDPIQNKKNKSIKNLPVSKPIDIPKENDSKEILHQLAMLEDIIYNQFVNLNNKLKY